MNYLLYLDKGGTSSYAGSYFLSDNDDMIRIKTSGKGQNAAKSREYSVLPKNGYAAVGHAGNLVIDNSGNMIVYDYGRFVNGRYGKKSSNGLGIVRKVNIGNVNKINGLIDDSGNLDNKALNEFLSKRWANGRQVMSGRGKASPEESIQYWEALANNKDRGAYSTFGNNCTSAAARASLLGTILTGTPGNEGFWIPRQGLAMLMATGNHGRMTVLPQIFKKERQAGGTRRYGLNDVTSQIWASTPMLLLNTLDAGRKIWNTGKNLFTKNEK